MDIASELCKHAGIPHVRIDGTTPPFERRRNINTFVGDPETSVLLMTFGTGALGWVEITNLEVRSNG